MKKKILKHLASFLVITGTLFAFLYPTALKAEQPYGQNDLAGSSRIKSISIYENFNTKNDGYVPFNTFIFPRPLQVKFEKQWNQYLAIDYMYYSKPMGIDTLDGTEQLSSQLSEDLAKNIIGSVIKYHFFRLISLDSLNLGLISSSQTPMPTIFSKEDQNAYIYFTPLTFTNISFSGLFPLKNYRLNTFISGFQIDPSPTMIIRHVSPICSLSFGYNILNGTKTIGLEKQITHYLRLQASVKEPFSEKMALMGGISFEF